MDSENSLLGFAAEIAYGHHERWDGTGYPRGLSGDDIPLSARLMAVADVYDALTTKRPYKDAFTHEESIAMMEAGRALHFDPDIIDAMLSIQNEFIDIAQRYKDTAL
jgi:putative two-component system response regulator